MASRFKIKFTSGIDYKHNICSPEEGVRLLMAFDGLSGLDQANIGSIGSNEGKKVILEKKAKDF